MAAFNEGFNIVIGTRDSKMLRSQTSRTSIIYQEIARKYRKPSDSVDSGTRYLGHSMRIQGFTDQLAESVFPKQKIDRWGFDIEILFLSRMLGYKIGIIPVNWVNDPDSKVSLKGYLQVFKELFQVRLNQLKGVYK